eukprot:s286_g22.t1
MLRSDQSFVESKQVCGQQITPTTPVKLIDFGVAKSLSGTIARSCVGTTEIMAPELVSAKLMIAPKGASMKKHGPYTFKPPQDHQKSCGFVYPLHISNRDRKEASPGFGIVTQRPDGKGAMVNGIEAGGQAAQFNVGDGWAIASINGTEILEMPFDFNELGAGTKAGVTAITEILGGLTAPFSVEFVELPKREFTKAVDLWSLGVTMYVMLTGVKPFTDRQVRHVRLGPKPVEGEPCRTTDRGPGVGPPLLAAQQSVGGSSRTQSTVYQVIQTDPHTLICWVVEAALPFPAMAGYAEASAQTETKEELPRFADLAELSSEGKKAMESFGYERMTPVQTRSFHPILAGKELLARAKTGSGKTFLGLQGRAPDVSRHCRTSSASSRSQWALPDLNRELQIPVGTAGPQPRVPDPSGHCRTSTASSRSQWALPDLNRELQIPAGTAGPQPRVPDPSGHCRTSTAR